MKKNSGSTLAVVSVIVALVVILGVGSIAYVQMQTKRSQSNKENVASYQESDEEKQLAAFEMKKAASYTSEANERDSYYKFYPILLLNSHEYFDSCLKKENTDIEKMAEFSPGTGWESTNGTPKYSDIENLATFAIQTDVSSIGGYILTKVNGTTIKSGDKIPKIVTAVTTPGTSTTVTRSVMYDSSGNETTDLSKATYKMVMLKADGTETENISEAVPQNSPYSNYKIWQPGGSYSLGEIVYDYNPNIKESEIRHYREYGPVAPSPYVNQFADSSLPKPAPKANFWRVLQSFTDWGVKSWRPGATGWKDKPTPNPGAVDLFQWIGDATPYLTTKKYLTKTITETVTTPGTSVIGVNNVNLEFTKYVKVPAVKILGVSFGDKYYKYTYTETLNGPLTSLTATNTKLVVERVKAGDVPNISLNIQTTTTEEEKIPIGSKDMFKLWGFLKATDTTLINTFPIVGGTDKKLVNDTVSIADKAINEAKKESKNDIPTNAEQLHGELVDLHNASNNSIGKINIGNNDTTKQQEVKELLILNSLRVLAEEYKVQLLILAQLYQTSGISDSTKASLNVISVRANRVYDILDKPGDSTSMVSLATNYMNATTDATLNSNKMALLTTIDKVININSAMNGELSKIKDSVIKDSADLYIEYFNKSVSISDPKFGTVPTLGTVPFVTTLKEKIGQLSTVINGSTGSNSVVVTDTNATTVPFAILSGARLSIVSPANMVAGNFTNTLKFNDKSALPTLTASSGNDLFKIQPGESKNASVSSGQTVTLTCVATYDGREFTPTITIVQKDRNTVTVTINGGGSTGTASLDMIFNQ